MDTSTAKAKESKSLGKLWLKLKSSLRSRKNSNSPPAPARTETDSPAMYNRHGGAGEQNIPIINPSPTRIADRSAPNPTMLPTTNITTEPSLSSTSATAFSATAAASHSQPIPERISTGVPHPVPPLPADVPMIEAEPDEIELDPNDTGSGNYTPESITPTNNHLTTGEPKTEVSRRHERAQAIFRKYNVDFNEEEWDSYPKVPVERVNRSPRIRVRWTCHECKTSFGHDKVCVECAHQRCRKCLRHPLRKKPSKIDKSCPAVKPTTTQQVNNGACHECQTEFSLGMTECTNCHHQICEKCLHETVWRSQQPQADMRSAVVDT